MTEETAINRTLDVLVLGAGPAGLSAALWCRDLGLSVTVVESASRCGGQLNSIYSVIRNYPGIVSQAPAELIRTMTAQARTIGATFMLGQNVGSLDLEDRSISLAGAGELRGSALIIATGVRRRKLGVPGEDKFAGRGILESGTKEHGLVNRGVVAVVGGGDAALENALILSKAAGQVILIHRGDTFRARDEFLTAVRSSANISVLTNSRVLAFTGGSSLTGIEVEKEGSLEAIETPFALVRIGVEPNSDLLRGSVDLDEYGYVVTDSAGQTNVPLVYAIGDVALRHGPTIAAAVGMGAAAAKHIEYMLRRRSRQS